MPSSSSHIQRLLNCIVSSDVYIYLIEFAQTKESIDGIFIILSEAVVGNDDIQLKGLQCMMPLLSHTITIHGDDLYKVRPSVIIGIYSN